MSRRSMKVKCEKPAPRASKKTLLVAGETPCRETVSAASAPDQLFAQVRDLSVAVSLAAVEALGRLGGAAVVDTLTEAVLNADGVVRRSRKLFMLNKRIHEPHSPRCGIV